MSHVSNDDSKNKLALTNGAYDVLKNLALYWLPALGTFYFAIAQIWGLPYAEEVVGTIVALDALLGAFIGISRTAYLNDPHQGDGTILLNTSGPARLDLDLNLPLDELQARKQVILTVAEPSKDASQ